MSGSDIWHMIKRLYRSKSDIENLSRMRILIPNDVDRNNYHGVIVKKPWGYEYLMFENPYVAVWILFLQYTHATSIHAHPNKKTSMIVLSGRVIFSTLEGWFQMKAGEGAVIEQAVFHSIKAITKKGAFLMEVETPPNKRDLVRFKDDYGRESKGYEGVESIAVDTNGYEYLSFPSVTNRKRRIKQQLGVCVISVCFHKGLSPIGRKIKREIGSIICMLKGILHDEKGKILLGTGEATSLADLRLRKNILSSTSCVYLIIHHE